MQHAALRQGASFASAVGDDGSSYSSAADSVLCTAQSFWNEDGGYFNANEGGGRSGIDNNAVLASIHTFDVEAGCDANTFQPCSDRALSNLKEYVDSFRGLYIINPTGDTDAILTGRYKEDSYQGGNVCSHVSILCASTLTTFTSPGTSTPSPSPSSF